MTTRSNTARVAWGAIVLSTGLLALAAAALAQAPAAPAPAPAPPGVNALGAALQEFQARLDQYLAMRAGLTRKIKPLSPSPEAAELVSRQEAMSAAIRTARAGAKQGNLIPTLVSSLIVRTVQEDFNQRGAAVQSALYSEVPEQPGAVLLNKVYPPGEPLPTTPPLLLANLPKLPETLQYRFTGRDLVIMDLDTQVVIDYIAGVLPR
jgi:hypothetical protein